MIQWSHEIVSNVLSDESADLKAEKQKYTEAKEAMKGMLTQMKSDYIQNFGRILDNGVDELEVSLRLLTEFRIGSSILVLQKRTEEELKTEKNATKRHEIIDFATKSFERLIKFVKEVEENLPNSDF